MRVAKPVDEDDIDSPDAAPPTASAPPAWRIDLAPLLRGLNGEAAELELARRRTLREVQEAMRCARLRIEAALADAPVDGWLDVAIVCKGLTQLPVEAAVAELEASRRIEVDRGRVRRGPAWRH
jgi:hypothetical protein